MVLVTAEVRAINESTGPDSLKPRFGQRLPLTLCHFEHFDLLLSGGAHFLNRGQDGRKSLDESLF